MGPAKLPSLQRIANSWRNAMSNIVGGIVTFRRPKYEHAFTGATSQVDRDRFACLKHAEGCGKVCYRLADDSQPKTVGIGFDDRQHGYANRLRDGLDIMANGPEIDFQIQMRISSSIIVARGYMRLSRGEPSLAIVR
jgi:hypothetical protein